MCRYETHSAPRQQGGKDTGIACDGQASVSDVQRNYRTVSGITRSQADRGSNKDTQGKSIKIKIT